MTNKFLWLQGDQSDAGAFQDTAHKFIFMKAQLLLDGNKAIQHNSRRDGVR